jgi:hypothetical protein
MRVKKPVTLVAGSSVRLLPEREIARFFAAVTAARASAVRRNTARLFVVRQ